MGTEIAGRDVALREVLLPVPDGEWSNAHLPSIRGDSSDFKLEIVDGALLIRPMPTLWHVMLQRRLADQLRPQCPAGWEPGVEVPIRIASGRRVADVAVVRSAPRGPLGAHNYEPDDVGLVIEVESPSTRRTDRTLKTEDYAHAGITGYVRIETEPALVLVAFRLRGDIYVESVSAASGAVTVPGADPYVVDLDLLAGDAR